MNKGPSKGKIVLITGTSSGFGLLTAARLASRGYKVIATMRNLEKQGPLLSEVNRRRGEVRVMRIDVTDNESIEEAAYAVASEYGHIDVLVNNAGQATIGAFEDLTEQEIRNQMETNFFGVQNVTREFIPLLRQRKRAKIINISSVSGFFAFPTFGAYSASKWALEAFSESLRFELFPFGIDVLLVEPGSYKTKLFYENFRFAKHFDNTQSPYYNLSQGLKEYQYKNLKDNFRDPEDVAVLIERLITSSKNPFRNIPDTSTKLAYFARKWVPFKIYDFFGKKKLRKMAPSKK